MDFKRIYRAAIRESVRPLFGAFERLGVHVTPIHFYQPIPDTARLPSNLWTRRSEMLGVDLREPAQLKLLETLAQAFRNEYSALPMEPVSDPAAFHLNNGSFGSVDAEILYALLRQLQPRRMIEIGSGNSTLLAAQALMRNAADGAPARYTVIDPFPRPIVAHGLPGVTDVAAIPVEEAPLATFEELGEGDVLFIDSSHVVRIGGDVVWEYLEILPRLQPGVFVHIHDIFLPFEYPRDLIEKRRWFWSEQYLLQTFLSFNAQFEVVWAGAYMASTHPERLRAAIPSFGPGVLPGSFWIRRRD